MRRLWTTFFSFLFKFPFVHFISHVSSVFLFSSSTTKHAKPFVEHFLTNIQEITVVFFNFEIGLVLTATTFYCRFGIRATLNCYGCCYCHFFSFVIFSSFSISLSQIKAKCLSEWEGKKSFVLCFVPEFNICIGKWATALEHHRVICTPHSQSPSVARKKNNKKPQKQYQPKKEFKQ